MPFASPIVARLISISESETAVGILEILCRRVVFSVDDKRPVSQEEELKRVNCAVFTFSFVLPDSTSISMS